MGTQEVEDLSSIPEAIHFVTNITDFLAQEFPDLWKMGQAYFKGDLVVEPDGGKSAVFKEMVLGGIRYFCNLIRAAVIPQTFKNIEDAVEYGDWPTILIMIRKLDIGFP